MRDCGKRPQYEASCILGTKSFSKAGSAFVCSLCSEASSSPWFSRQKVLPDRKIMDDNPAELAKQSATFYSIRKPQL